MSVAAEEPEDLHGLLVVRCIAVGHERFLEDDLLGLEIAADDRLEGPTTLHSMDGVAKIATPCAEGTATYAIDGASLILGDVVIDDPFCPIDERSARLTLTRGDVGLMLRTDWLATSSRRLHE